MALRSPGETSDSERTNYSVQNRERQRAACSRQRGGRSLTLTVLCRGEGSSGGRHLFGLLGLPAVLGRSVDVRLGESADWPRAPAITGAKDFARVPRQSPSSRAPGGAGSWATGVARDGKK